MAEWNGMPLPDDFDSSILESEHIKNTPDVPTLLKRFNDSKRYADNLATSSIRPPAPDTSEYKDPAAWRALQAKAMNMAPPEIQSAYTVPETAEGYGIEVPEGLPADQVASVLEKFQGMGITKAQARDLMQMEFDAVAARNDAATKLIEERDGAVAESLGKAAEKIKQEAKAAIATFGEEGFGDQFASLMAKASAEELVALQTTLSNAAENLKPEALAHIDIETRNAMSNDQLDMRINEALGSDLYTRYRQGNLQSVDERRAAEAMHRQIMGWREQRTGGSEAVATLGLNSIG